MLVDFFCLTFSLIFEVMSLKLSIHQLSEEDRPREKLLLKGRQQLSNAELLAILIGSGNKDKNAIELAQEILYSAQNNLNELAKLSVKDLTKFLGIGEAKAITIASALELGRRRKEDEFVTKPKVTSSRDAYNIITPYLIDVPHEEFWVLCLNRANQLIKAENVSSGGLSGTVADPKVIFKKALDNNSSGLILIHNHPSGNTKPSQADLKITQQLKEAGSVLEIPVLDHLIFTEKSYYSFADEGIL